MLSDAVNHVFGIVDLAIPGPNGLIIDLKTGRDATADPSPAIKHQMTFYAHLFQRAYGALPENVIVFSLQRGPKTIDVTPFAIASLLEQVRAAQLSEGRIARPQADTCQFCTKRMSCTPHWSAIPDWDHADAIEGVISKVEHSSSGTAALLIGGKWLTGIPASTLPDGTGPGQFARAVRVRRRNDSTPEEWAVSSTTRIRIVPVR